MNPETKPLIKEWLEKAEGDYEAALSLYKSRKKKKLYFIIAFHCQQSIEKYLKALSICYRVEFPKTHDLLRLLLLIEKRDPFLSALKEDLRLLNPFAVGFRYPGDDIDLLELKKAIKITKNLRKILIKRIRTFF
ncbi:MAG: HEPN domain-containing protein [Candidatus Saganbacteria bacterium]|nr:HEPN domain-containing protein [Candidatus Saganbacteria bacterium]